jgi:hypothetical protein
LQNRILVLFLQKYESRYKYWARVIEGQKSAFESEIIIFIEYGRCDFKCERSNGGTDNIIIESGVGLDLHSGGANYFSWLII